MVIVALEWVTVQDEGEMFERPGLLPLVIADG